ncbi:MAG: hypothetical protein J6S58_00020 [Lentisphaeria bacterium]|nr:hypothetical protein [Lentisphaeria bacterium]
MSVKSTAHLLLFSLICTFPAVILPLHNLPAAELLKDGKAQALIVLREKAPGEVRLAAAALQKHLQNLTGAEFEIVSDCDRKVLQCKNILSVGENSITEKAGYRKRVFPEGTSAYEIRIRDGLVILNGPVTFHKRRLSAAEKGFHAQSRYQISANPSFTAADNGVMHAVSAFLEELGVRFYAPGKTGTYYPRKKDIILEDKHIVKQAAFPVREYVLDTRMKICPETENHLQMLKYGSAHYPLGVLPLSDVMREHKALPRARDRYGEKLVSLEGYGVPLYADKTFRKACIARMRRIFDEDPSLKILQVIQPASRGSFDRQELQDYAERIRYPAPPPSVSILLDFHKTLANALKKTHPGKKILYVVAGNGRGSDSVTKDLPGNMQGSPAAIPVHQYAGAGRYLKNLKLLTGTFGGGKGIQREYWNEFTFQQIPRQGFYFLKKLQSVRQVQKDHLRGVVTDLPLAPGRKTSAILAGKELMHLALYVNAKLLWDPDLDLDKLLSEYFLLYYGPAAAEMRNFHFYGEYVYAKNGSRTLSPLSGCLQKEDAEVFFELLRQAKAKTEQGSLYRKRILALEKALAWMKTAFDENEPTGTPVTGEVVAWNEKCNADLKKYKKFQPLLYGNTTPATRTEFAVAARECRSNFLLAVRCYEPRMEKLKRSGLQEDSEDILKYDHIRILFRSSRNGPCEVILSSSGAVMDRIWDPAMLQGTPLHWNKSTHLGKVRYFKDRWEAEITFGDIGQFPDRNPAWGIRIERVRFTGGKKEVISSCEGPRYAVGKWNRFTLPRVDSAGAPTWDRDMVIRSVPGIPDGQIYTIRKADPQKKLLFTPEAWKDPATWGKAPEARLGNILHYYYRSNKKNYHPDPSFKMLYDNQNLYVFYKVRDRYVRSVSTRDQDMVCLDSCMELFIMPHGKGSYFNFEMNCTGALLLAQISKSSMQKLTPDELKTIKRFHSIPRCINGEIVGDTVWYAGLQIPLEIFIRRAKVTLPLKGQVWKGNVFKCADWSSQPCWMAWKKTTTFHSVAGFGKFIFE